LERKGENCLLKEIVKKIIPLSMLNAWRRKVAEKQQSEFASKTATETFSEIYANNLWGGEKGEFYSGTGSEGKYAEIYIATIRKFFSENNIKSAVDLGCGDFRVGSQFVSNDLNYVGVDVVPKLVEHLNKTQATERISFQCLNIAEDELPKGEVCLIREVLQHLSNDEIGKVLRNCKDFKYLIITEYQPSPRPNIVPNLDIPHGPQIRLHFNSGVYLDKPPFGLKISKTLAEVETAEGNLIGTFLIEQ
jgi:Methyltransferase domain